MEDDYYRYEEELANTNGVDMNSSNECMELTVEGAKYFLDTGVYSQAMKVFTGIVFPFLLCAGVIGNLLFLYVVYRMPAMRTATNWFLANLAVADILFLSFAIGEKLWMYHHSPFINDRLSFGDYGCPIIFTLIDASHLATIFMVTLVSTERYYAVCRTRTNTRKATLSIALVVISWIVSITFAASFIPAWIVKGTTCLKWPDVDAHKDLPMYIGSCIATTDNYLIYVDIARTLPFFVMGTLNCWMYVCIVRSITRMNRHSRISGGTDDNMKQRNQIARMLVINGLIFFICLVPFEIYLLLSFVSRIRGLQVLISQGLEAPFIYVSRTMAYINSVINPVIYIGMSERYRDAFKKVILCRREADHDPTDSTIKTETSMSGQTYTHVDTEL